MSSNVLIYDRPASGDAFWRNITHWVPAWEHQTRAMGGYWEAGGTIHGPAALLHQLYDRWIGSLVVEMTYGLVSWRGIVWELNLIEGGAEHRRSLDPVVFRNKEKVVYRSPKEEDSEQGNLSYTTEVDGGSTYDTFTDDGQDFSDWETASGDCRYKIEVVNDDDSKCWGFLGAKVSNTEIKVFEAQDQSDKGWHGDEDGKTPTSYNIVDTERGGNREETAWAEIADSVEQFYTAEGLITEGEMATWAAQALRDTHLARYGWPRSRMTGGLTLQGGEVVAQEASLEVVCRGLWHTLESVVIESALHGSGQSVIQMVLDESDYVSADRLETSGLNCAFRCDETPLTGMEIIEKVLERGDDEGNLWQGGVYEDGFVYEAQPTAVEYFLRSGRLVDRGGQRVIPALLKPGFLLRNASAPGRGAPPGAAVRDDPRVAYVEEVRFRAPDELELKFAGQKRSVEVVEQMLRRQRGERQ